MELRASMIMRVVKVRETNSLRRVLKNLGEAYTTVKITMMAAWYTEMKVQTKT
jgi:ribosomal protein S4E